MGKKNIFGIFSIFLVITLFSPTSLFAADDKVVVPYDVECHCEMAVGLLTQKGLDLAKANKSVPTSEIARLTIYQYREADKKSFKIFAYLFEDQDPFFPVKWAQIEFARALNEKDSAVEFVSDNKYKLKEKNIEAFSFPSAFIDGLISKSGLKPFTQDTPITIKKDAGAFACFPSNISKTHYPLIKVSGGYLPVYLNCKSLKYNPETTLLKGEAYLGGGTPDGTGTGGGGGCYLGVCNLNQLGTTSLPQLIGRALSFLTGIIGAVALAVFVYGGFLWMLSMGSPERIKKAQALLLWGGLGTMVIVASYAIVTFLFDIF
ncbi:MAG: pilin [Candidatus Magasanikbacteria bacterium]